MARTHSPLNLQGRCNAAAPDYFRLVEPLPEGGCALLVREDFLDVPLRTDKLWLDSLYVAVAHPPGGDSSVLFLQVCFLQIPRPCTAVMSAISPWYSWCHGAQDHTRHTAVGSSELLIDQAGSCWFLCDSARADAANSATCVSASQSIVVPWHALQWLEFMSLVQPWLHFPSVCWHHGVILLSTRPSTRNASPLRLLHSCMHDHKI